MKRHMVGTIGLGLLLSAGPASGVEPRPLLDDLAKKIQEREIVQMVRAIAGGSQMGLGDGWFKPSQSQYHWSWLAGHSGVNRNGVIEPKQFLGPAEWFNRLDRDRDGVLSAVDFDWSDRSPLNRHAQAVNSWFRRADSNSNGRLTDDEWQALFNRASKGKGYLTPDDLREAFPLSPPARPGKKDDGPSPAVLLNGLLRGELGSFFEGPDLGQKAPDFRLMTADGQKTIRLGEHLGDKPMVLIFGSFT